MLKGESMGEIFPLSDEEYEMTLRHGPPAKGDPETGVHFGEGYGLIGQGGEADPSASEERHIDLLDVEGPEH